MDQPETGPSNGSGLLSRFWTFLERGIPARTTYLQRRSLMLMRVGVCLALLSNVLIFIGYITGSTGVLSLINISCSTALYSLSLALMLRGWNSLGRNLFAIAIIIMTWQVCLFIAPQSQTILFYVPISIGGTLLWSGQRIKQIAFALISIGWYLISAYTISAIHFHGENLPSNPANPSLILNMVVVFGATFLIAAASEESASNLQTMLLSELQRNQKLLADAMPSFVLNQLARDGELASATSPNASFVIVDITNLEELETTLTENDLYSMTSEALSRLSFFVDRYQLVPVRTEGYAVVAIAKQGDLGLSHPNTALDFAIASRNSLSDITGRREAKLQFRIGAACTHINGNDSPSIQQIQRAWGVSLDKASRLVSSAPLNQIQIDAEMQSEIEDRFHLTPSGGNYVLA